ncbi:MAG: phosphate signaling complex protein PhoU [Erysipelotrichaceae bacterium]
MVRIEKELDTLEETLITMGNKVITMHQNTLSLFTENNCEKALEIIAKDDFINKLEEDINDQCLASLALLSPVASDLRRVITAIKIASELERIADYAKNTASFMIKHQIDNAYVIDYTTSMEKKLIEMLSETMEAYKNRDLQAAFDIPEKDKHIDQLFNELKEKLKENEDLEAYRHIFSISSMLRNMERAGDHTINICEHIIYLIKGQHYDFG